MRFTSFWKQPTIGMEVQPLLQRQIERLRAEFSSERRETLRFKQINVGETVVNSIVGRGIRIPEATRNGWRRKIGRSEELGDRNE